MFSRALDLIKGVTHSHQEQAHRGQEAPQDQKDRQDCQVGPEWCIWYFLGEVLKINFFCNFSLPTLNSYRRFYNTWPAPAIPPVFLLSSELKKFARTPDKKRKIERYKKKNKVLPSLVVAPAPGFPAVCSICQVKTLKPLKTSSNWQNFKLLKKGG